MTAKNATKRGRNATQSKKIEAKQYTRDEIRAATLGAPIEFKRKLLNINGVPIEFRQPSIGTREKINKILGEDWTLPKFVIYSIIKCGYVPNTDTLVFEDADFKAMLDCPPSSWIDEAGSAVVKLMNISADEEKKS